MFGGKILGSRNRRPLAGCIKVAWESLSGLIHPNSWNRNYILMATIQWYPVKRRKQVRWLPLVQADVFMLAHARTVSESCSLPSQPLTVLSSWDTRMGLPLLGLRGDRINKDGLAKSLSHSSTEARRQPFRYRYWVLWSRARIIIQTEAPSTTPSRPRHQGKKLQPKIVHRTIYVLHPLPPERILRSRRSLLTLASLAKKYDEVSLPERYLLHAGAMFYVGSLAFDSALQEITRQW